MGFNCAAFFCAVFVAASVCLAAADLPFGNGGLFRIFPKEPWRRSPPNLQPAMLLAPPLPSRWQILPMPIRLLKDFSARSVKGVMGVLRFQPPVGAILALQLYRLLRRKSILEDASRFFPTRWRHSRSLNLDTGDREYEVSGGVHFVRVELYLKLLKAMTAQGTNATAEHAHCDKPLASLHADINKYIGVLVQSLMLRSGPGSLDQFIASSIEHLDTLSSIGPHAMAALRTSASGVRYGSPEVIEGLWAAAKVLIQLRAADALLRLLRNKILSSARILEQAESTWKAKVVARSRFTALRRKLSRSEVIERQRQELAVASAMFDQQLRRLGEVQMLLLTQPPLLASSVLVNPEVALAATDGTEQMNILTGSDRPHHFDEVWVATARQWTRSARSLVAEIVSQTLRSIESELPTTEEHRAQAPSADVDQLVDWVVEGSAGGWQAALKLVKAFPQTQRVHRSLLPVYAYTYKKCRAVLSSLSQLLGAKAIHVVLKPHWPEMARVGRAGGRMARETFERRVYTPLHEIILDLLNRQPRLIDSAALDEAETSLGVMLRDLLGSKEVQQNRTAALESVAREFESEMRAPLRNIIFGKLVRLMLIQVQELKAELLKAMGGIDDLVDANRFNMLLFASVPAVLLLAIGYRLCLAPVYMLRTRARVRSLREVHAEMTNHLKKMERCLLLASCSRPELLKSSSRPRSPTSHRASWLSRRRKGPAPALNKLSLSNKTSSGSTASQARMIVASSTGVQLSVVELGEFVLLVHSYLLLLDLSSPPFSRRACDAIHHDVQDLLWPGKLTTSQQLSLLQMIRTQHAVLGRSLSHLI